MASRRLIVFTVFLLMLAAAPVWANTANLPDLPRITSSVMIDGVLPEDRLRLDALNTSYSPEPSSCDLMMTCLPVLL